MAIAAQTGKPPILLLVSVGQAYGGAETYYLKLAKILLPHYFIVAIVCNRHLQDEFLSLGIEALYAMDHSSIANRYIATLLACRTLKRRIRPALAHLNGQPESYVAIFLRWMGIRSITTRHTPFTTEFFREGSRIPAFIKRYILILSLRCALKTICVSKLLESQLVAHLPSRKLSYIPTWVDGKFLGKYNRPVDQPTLRVLFVGRISSNKGIFDAIEAVRRCSDVHLTVVGEGEQMDEAQRLAANLPVTFLGFMSDCRPAYLQADLLLFASREGFEGLPQVPLEAMAVGLPCLASDISSVLEIAQDGALSSQQAMATYKQGDVDDLVQQLTWLTNNRDELRRLSRAGRARIEKNFTEARVAGPYLHEFAAVLNE